MSSLLKGARVEATEKAAANAAARAVGRDVRIEPERREHRVAPLEYRDAVEAFARRFGGHGDLVWIGPPANVWQVRLTLKPGDPRLQGGDEVYETVELHEWVDPRPDHPAFPKDDPQRIRKLRRHPRSNRIMAGYVAFELDELGVQGLTTMLEKGSLLTGRGEFQSAEQAMKRQLDLNRERQQKMRRAMAQRTRDLAKDVRRRVLKIPFLPVGIELSRRTTE